jgi:hypothetical protein
MRVQKQPTRIGPACSCMNDSHKVLAPVNHHLPLAVDLLASQQRFEVSDGGLLSGFAGVWPHRVDAWNRDEIFEDLVEVHRLSPFHITKASLC